MPGLFTPDQKPNIGRLKARGDRKGLADALHLVVYPALVREAARALADLGWQPEADEDGAAYWIALEMWGDCIQAGVRAVEPLLDALRVRVRDIENAGNMQKAANDIQAVQQIIKSLVRIGSPAVHPLVDALSDKDIFEPVSEALVKIGASAVQPLLYALRDAGEYDLADIPRVLDNLGWHPDRSESSAYYWMGKGDLERCGGLGAVAVQPLINSFRFRSALRVRLGRQAVMETLARMGPAAVEPLLRAMRSEFEPVRQGALETLGMIGDPRTAALLENAQRLSARKAASQVSALDSIEEIQKNLQDASWRMRRSAVEALGKIGVQPGDLKLRSKILNALETAFKDSEELVRAAAVEALAALRDPREARMLAKLLQDRSEIVRLAVVETLGNSNDQSVLRMLAGLLRDPKKRVRTAVVWALAQTGNPEAMKPLLGVMQGSDSYLSQPAAEALDKLGWKPGMDETGAAYWVARRNWEACIPLGAQAIRPLVHALEHFRGVRGAVWALGQICLLPETGAARRQGVEGLLNSLNHYDEDIRQTAARELVHIYPSSLLDENQKVQIRSRQKEIRAYGIDLPL